MRFILSLLGLALLSACATVPKGSPSAPVTVKIIAFNDFHGALDLPKLTVDAVTPDGRKVAVPAGGVAEFATAIDTLRAKNAYNVVVSAGDMIGASPLISAAFLDEPTILAMNAIGVDVGTVGNHEFDRGRAELLRIQNGGCQKLTLLEPCKVDPSFPGAKFRLLAANVLTESGAPLFPATTTRSFGTGRGRVTIGFVGLTLKDTSSLVSPTGIAGLRFADEAATINARATELKAAGADAVVVLIHQGLYTDVGYNDKSCGGVSGSLLDIARQLSPDVDLIVSGHTHRAYICALPRDAGPTVLATSANLRGSLLTDIDLTFDPVTHHVVARRADNIIVASPAYAGAQIDAAFPLYAPRADIAALVERYRRATAAVRDEVVGVIGGAATRYRNDAGESVLGNMIADAQLDATRSAGAQIALMNPDGFRVDLIPDAQGRVTFGQIFTVQPFTNELITRTFTGAQLRAVLEQGLDDPAWLRVMSISRGFRFAFDLSRPIGQRVIAMTLDGAPVSDAARYRVATNSYLAAGGDRFTALTKGTDDIVGMIDRDAFRAYIAAGKGRTLPATDRIDNRTTGPRLPMRQPT